MRSLATNTLFLFLLAISVFACFGKVLSFGYVTYDDASHVYQNSLFLPVTAKSFWAFWRAPIEHLYMPVTYTAWGLATLFGTKNGLDASPEVFHKLNLVFHFFNGVLVYFVLRHFVKHPLSRFFGAALFLFHPLQVEATAWISALKDILSAFWALWSLEFFLRWKEKKSHRLEFAVLFFFLLAILTKPWAAILPLVWFVIDSKAIKLWVPAALPVTLVFWITSKEQPSHEIANQVAWYFRPQVMLDSFSFYFSKLFHPVGFTVNYGRNPRIAVSSPIYLYSLISLVLAWILVRRWQAGRRVVFLGVGIFLVSLLPTSGIFPFFYQKYSTVAYRFAYFGLLGPALILACLMDRVSLFWLKVICAMVLIFLGLRSHVLLKHWTDDISLVARMARVAPSADHSFNLAQMISFEMEGKVSVPGLATRPAAPPRTDEERKIWLGVIEWNYRDALRLRPHFAEAHNGLGMVLAQQGRMIPALVSFQESVRLDPKFAMGWYNLGQAYELLGKKSLALAAFTKAKELDPAATARLDLP